MKTLSIGFLFLLPAASLAQGDLWDDEDWGEERHGLVWSGFVEGGFGTRTDSDPLLSSLRTLEDLRWRVETERAARTVDIRLAADARYDGISADWDVEIRDLTAAFSLGKSVDIRIGRQIQSWGTGDLLFLNDLFPKDFVSFFAGRDDEYLKAAGDAFRISRFGDTVNLDFVWAPVFEPDEYLTGERFSFFSPLAGQNVAPRPPLNAIDPDDDFGNGEFALRLFRNVEGREYALYGYRGFFKQPNALTDTFEPTFAPLNSLGASLRQPLGSGLLNIEASYYVSRDDRDGDDPLLPNDQARLLAGFEWEAKTNFTVGLQYYLEWTLDYDALAGSATNDAFLPDEFRHLLTNRLTYRRGRDRHTYMLFTFFSPSDGDFYLRPRYDYRHSDRWSLSAGGNIFGGNEPHTFFNQLADASNAYLRVRYHY